MRLWAGSQSRGVARTALHGPRSPIGLHFRLFNSLEAPFLGFPWPSFCLGKVDGAQVHEPHPQHSKSSNFPFLPSDFEAISDQTEVLII